MNEPFSLLPVLRGQRVLLRPLCENDWKSLFQAASDPKIWEQHPAHNRFQEPVFREFFDQAMESGLVYVFVDTESDKIFGSSRYHGFDPELDEIEIGWTFLARPYWGGIYNAEIKTLMLEHAFRHVTTCVFWVGETNWRSRRAVEKIGGKLRPGTFQRADSPLPHVLFEIRKEDFSKRDKPA